MRPLIAYIRVSSKEQGKSGVGLEVQRARIHAFAEASGYQIVRVYAEVASAIGCNALKDRPQLTAAREHARSLGCPIAVTQINRLSRSAGEIVHVLTELGSDIVVVQDSPDAIRIKTEAAGIQKQTELLKKSTQDGIKRAKERGVRFGNPTNLPVAQQLGAQANQTAARARQSELAPMIAGIRAEGITSGAEIAKRLNELGKKTPRGNDWTDANIRRVLRDICREESEQQKIEAAYRADPRFGEWG